MSWVVESWAVEMSFIYIFIRFIVLSSTYDFPLSFCCLINMCYCNKRTFHQNIFWKISVLKKACLCSSCSTVRTKKFKRIHVEEFLFSEITVLERATLLDNEVLHRHFPTFLIVQWYKGIVGHYTIVLKIHRSFGKNGKNIKRGIPKRGNKIWRGMVPLGYPLQSSYACNFFHAIFSTCTYE